MDKLLKQRIETMGRRLKAAGLKSTPQRRDVIRVLAESDSHPGVEEIWVRLRKKHPKIGRATVYRNIRLLKSLGEIVEVGLPGSGSRYDGRRPYPHPHLVCLDCGKILDPEPAAFRILTEEIAAASGFEISGFRLDFFGTCPDCRKQKKAK